MEIPRISVGRVDFDPRRKSSDSGMPIPSLKEVLRDEELRSYIMAYATQNYQDESLLFWIAADEFLKIPEGHRLPAARAIWHEFLEPSSEHEVTVEANSRATMQEFLEGAQEADIKADMFEDMKLELENVMTSNVYSEFCKHARKAGALDFAVKSARVYSPQESEDLRLKGAALMENLVIEPNNFGVLYALCQVYTINEQHEDEERAFLSGVVEILLEHDIMLPFLQYVVTREVSECNEVFTLFRGRTVFTLLLGDLLRRRPCVRFLSECTSTTFAEVLKQKQAIEVDPHRIDNSSDAERDAVRNAERLLRIADNLLETIRKRYAKCPPSVRKVFDLLSVVTADKFPQLRWKIVGSVFFLRFINPALSQPETHGLVSREVTSAQRRALVTLSKMLQFVTNDSRFDVASGAHQLLNAWVEAQVEGVETLFSQLVAVSDKDWTQTDLAAPRRKGSVSGTEPTNNGFVSPKGRGPASPKGPSSSPSPRSMKLLAQRINDRKDKIMDSLQRNDRLGRNLTAQESQALRLQVLDTLIKYQSQVKMLLNSNMATQTQWMWLKESLSSFLK